MLVCSLLLLVLFAVGGGGLASAVVVATHPVDLLTPSERQYLDRLGAITVCPDPDWPPYESLDEQGHFTGIAADLLKILEQRLGIRFDYVHAASWDESLQLSQSGKVLLLPFLNKSPKREQWLVFTEPLFSDPNVYITREDHAFVTDAGLLRGEVVAVPSGTAVEEKIRRDFPALQVLNTASSEADAFKAVAERHADLAVRSLRVAAYTIRKGGWFSLKIAGQAPEDYTNHLRIGVLKSEPMLRDILDKGIATITPQEREEIATKHTNITMVKSLDYTMALWFGCGLLLLVAVSMYWNMRLHKVNADLKESERSKSVLLRNLPGMAFRRRNDAALTMEFISEGCRDITGYCNDEVVMNKRVTFRSLFSPDMLEQYQEAWRKGIDAKQPVRVEYRIRTADGSDKWVLEQGVAVYDEAGHVQAIEGIVVDINEMKTVEEQIRNLASHDTLTGLLNRSLFADRVEQALRAAGRHGLRVALLFVDLDRFKPVNDAFGHEAGDYLLKTMAQRMREAVRESDTVARLGGDEFAVLLSAVASAENACRVANMIRNRVEHPVNLPTGDVVTISCSIGVSVYPDHAGSVRELLQLADMAMYRAKKSGRNAVEMHGMCEDTNVHVELASPVRFIWKPAYCSGNADIDREHSSLFELANALLGQLPARGEPEAPFWALFQSLQEHVEKHFAGEIALLRTVAYPDVEAHAQQHEALLEQLALVRRGAASDGFSPGEVVKLLVVDVVYTHLLESDRHYFDHLRSCGVASGGAAASLSSDT